MAMNVINTFGAWVQQSPNIRFAPASNGGWERWAQVDFALLLQAGGTQVHLEDHCFTDTAQHNDLTIIGVACIEFKVYNHLAETIVDYRNKIQEDQVKLEGLTLDPASAHNGKYSIGLGSEASIITGLQTRYGAGVNAGNVLNYMGQLFGNPSPYAHQRVAGVGGVGFIITFYGPFN